MYSDSLFTGSVLVARCLRYLDQYTKGNYIFVKIRTRTNETMEEVLGKFDGENFFPLDLSKLEIGCKEEPYGTPIPLSAIDAVEGVELDGKEWPLSSIAHDMALAQ